MGGLFQGRSGVVALALVFALALCDAILVKPCLAQNPEKPSPLGPAAQIGESDWMLRCVDGKGNQVKDKTPSDRCEAYKILVAGPSHTRVAELAVGFADPKSADSARGAIVLPLGVMLDKDALLKVDGNKPFAFKLLYCTNEGCFSLINASRDLLDQMKKGQSIHFLFQAMNGQSVDLSFRLAGFAEALKRTM